MIVEELMGWGIARELIIVIVAALPVIELRGAIPLAINVFGMPWYYAYVLAVLGNLIPVPILLLFLEALAKLVSKVKAGERFVQWIFSRTRKRSSIIERYEKIGLALFVAVPLPFTGAWTGAIAAFLLGLKFRYSMVAITCGVLIAGAIVTALSLLGWIGAVIAGIALSIVAGLGLWRN
jgi:uncharacterized membrane protein